MKRLLVSLLALVALAAPATAVAVPYRIHQIGINLKSAEIGDITNGELFIAPAANTFNVRAEFDRCHGEDPYVGSPAMSKYDQLVNSGATVLPVVIWHTTCHGAVNHIDTIGEINSFQAFTANVVAATNNVQAAHGVPQTNLIEIWNEPNKTVATGGYLLEDYHYNVFLTARAAARAIDPDIATLYGGLCFGTTGSNNCNDAINWVNAYQDRGYQGVSGWSIHTYGYTNTDTYVRESTASQTRYKAQGEFNRICAESRMDVDTQRPVFVTEMGRRTDLTFSDGLSQTSFMTALFNDYSWNAALMDVHPGEDVDTGSGSSGILNTAGAVKPSYQPWADKAPAAAYNGDTGFWSCHGKS